MTQLHAGHHIMYITVLGLRMVMESYRKKELVAMEILVNRKSFYKMWKKLAWSAFQTPVYGCDTIAFLGQDM